MILCFGEALIDMIPAKTATGEDAYVPRPGGAVFNTAVALGRLGADVGLVSGVSTDPFGKLLCERLEADGVNTRNLIRSDRPTTLAMVHLNNGAASYTFYDENSAGRMIAADDAPDLSSEVKGLFFGGVSLVSEPSGETYAGMLQRWRDGRIVMLDPNIRPGFISDAPRYRRRLTRMIAEADYLKVSDEDLLWLTGVEDIEAAARSFLGAGPSVVLVTLGARGALAVTESGRIDVAAPAVEVRDTVGAGDAFNAGFLFQLTRLGALRRDPDRANLERALRFGVEVAARACARVGADPPRLEDLAGFDDGAAGGRRPD